MEFIVYFKGEVCMFIIPRVEGKVKVVHKEDKPSETIITVTKSITCYFSGGIICLKKGSIINYTNIHNQ